MILEELQPEAAQPPLVDVEDSDDDMDLEMAGTNAKFLCALYQH
jgi:hypothetical protein